VSASRHAHPMIYLPGWSVHERALRPAAKARGKRAEPSASAMKKAANAVQAGWL